MAGSIGRNDPCPCGSGAKYKQCCLGKTPKHVAKRRVLLPLVIIAAGIGGGIFVGLSKGGLAGFAVAGAAAILAVIILVLRDPPPPSGKKSDSAAINFGK